LIMAKSNPKQSNRQSRAVCRRIQSSLIEHLEGQLAPEEGRTIDEHLSICPRCASELVSLRQTLSFLEHRELPEPDESFWMDLRYRVRQGIRKERPTAPSRPPIPAKAWVPAAAMASLFVFLFLWWTSHPRMPSPGQRPVLAQLEQMGQQSLETLSAIFTVDEELPIAHTPGDSLVELLASTSQPERALARLMIGEKMAQDPNFWEDIILEKAMAEAPVELLIEELTEGQLKRLSDRLLNLTG
jgi:hypothetical protein